jgi:hypothetical protein
MNQEQDPTRVPYVVTPPEYQGDPISMTLDGHFVGDDGFIVPRDFNEFYDRYPNYIRNWVKKKLGRFVVDEDIEDWTQDLIIHLKYLPTRSKHRKPGTNLRPKGCQDVIETFDPFQQYGASERRFRSYINRCLANKFNTVQGRRAKNPVCCPNNIPFGAGFDDINENRGMGGSGDEYVHQNSTVLLELTDKREKDQDDRLFLMEFIKYVTEEDETMLPVIEAIGKTGTQNEAAAYLREELGVDVADDEFVRYRNRLRQLAACFIDYRHASKPRKPYKRRETMPLDSLANPA